ncbi:MAG: DNA-binding protein [Thiohalocapsa sp. PB-PSB1]|nr:MAG: hypothetical protein N838_28350 [Thiohalocapsa sp. PB-PSB1]QQO54610.1 MAG: DNA-binding protein [Thiohalocapsa sp. PB-PSB1]HCS91906.1 DNA-binding protein [Chromatiaceae bacterium]
MPRHRVVETASFANQADTIWTESERLAFVSWIARNPLAGDVISGAAGARKVRWTVIGKGKRGGVRVTYFNRLAAGLIYLMAIYRKADQATIAPGDIPEVDP